MLNVLILPRTSELCLINSMPAPQRPYEVYKIGHHRISAADRELNSYVVSDS